MADPNNYDVEVELYFHDIDPLWNEMVFEGSVVMGPESMFSGTRIVDRSSGENGRISVQDGDAENSEEKGEVTIFGELIGLTSKFLLVFCAFDCRC